MKKETVEEGFDRIFDSIDYIEFDFTSFVEGVKWNQEKSYSEEELLNLLTHFAVEIQRQNKKGQYPIEIKSWFERNKEKFKKK